jgi:hypothetical protein
MTTQTGGAPYHRTVHTWTCPKGHTITIDDKGWPQQPGLKETIQRAFAKEKCGDPTCGGVLTYTHSDEPVVVADAEPRVPLALAGADLSRFGREFHAIPTTKGGAVAERAKAWARKR